MTILSHPPQLQPMMLSALLVLFTPHCFSYPVATSPAQRPAPSFDRRFEQRLQTVQNELPQIQKAAEEAADQTLQNPNLLITVPYSLQQTFAEELLNRSGGLVNALPEEERPSIAGPADIGLLSVASWPKDLTPTTNWLVRFHKDQRLPIVFASRQGAPTLPLEIRHLLDNGAGGEPKEESDSALNTLVNVVNGWLWCLEYTAALTRRGHHPGILQGIMEEGADTHNATIKKEGRNRLFPCRAPIPTGQLSRRFLRAVEHALAHVRSDAVQHPMSLAADRIAGRLRAGKTVGIASCAHYLLAEIHRTHHTPWKPINVVWQTRKGVLEKEFQPGDGMIWFGYIGISTPLEDYQTAIQKAGLDLVAASYAIDLTNPHNNAGPETIVIPQSWALPDAEIPLPFAPGHMGPLSGIESALIYRLLDEAVAERMGAR